MLIQHKTFPSNKQTYRFYTILHTIVKLVILTCSVKICSLCYYYCNVIKDSNNLIRNVVREKLITSTFTSSSFKRLHICSHETL
ncbi:hypothetical protein Trydic_g10724 [Trypoxylus dichotomus]